MNESFTLYNLDIAVTGDPAGFVCSHTVGHAFRVEGENLIFDSVGQRFSMYGLAALLPLLPVKQRPTSKNDWVTTDDYIACPDPQCSARFKITRTAQTTFNHSDVTRTPLADQ